MEFKFLDSKMPIDITNLIASFVGPKNNTFVKELNNLSSKIQASSIYPNPTFYDDPFSKGYDISDIRYAMKYKLIEDSKEFRFSDVMIDMENYFEDNDDIYFIMKFQNALLK
jgi:hypothetical protein